MNKINKSFAYVSEKYENLIIKKDNTDEVVKSYDNDPVNMDQVRSFHKKSYTVYSIPIHQICFVRNSDEPMTWTFITELTRDSIFSQLCNTFGFKID